jgi:hypothetical protein
MKPLSVIRLAAHEELHAPKLCIAALERVYDFMAMSYKQHRHRGLDPQSSDDVSK